MTNITMTLQDDTATLVLPLPEIPLTETPIEKSTDVENLLGDIKTYFITQKRQWSHSWKYLTKSEYDSIVGFYNRQCTLYKYPILTISDGSATNVTVRMTISQKNTVDNCSGVEGFQVGFRETSQLPEVTS